MAETPQQDPSGNQVVGDLDRQPPFSMTPHWVALAPISAQALRLYVLLTAHVNQRRGDSEVWPTLDQLAAMLSLKRGDQVAPYANELIKINAIEKRTIRCEGGMRQRNVYVVLGTPPPDWEGPQTMADWYRQHRTSPQVTPEPKNFGVREPRHSGVREPQHNRVREPRQMRVEPDQPKPDQREPDQPTNQPSRDHAEMDGMDGWLGSTTDGEKATGQPAPSNGRLLLQRQGVTGRALEEWAGVVDEAIGTLGRAETERDLTGNLNGVNNPAGAIVQHRLPRLRERLTAASADPAGGDGAQQQAEVPPWCGECDREGRDKPAHRRIEINGSIRRCPNCHPNPNPKGKKTEAGSGRSQEAGDKKFLAQLLASE